MVLNCSAWPRLKLNTKIGLHTTTTQTLLKPTFFGVRNLFSTQKILTQSSFGHKIGLEPKKFPTKIFLTTFFRPKSFLSLSKLNTFDLSFVYSYWRECWVLAPWSPGCPVVLFFLVDLVLIVGHIIPNNVTIQMGQTETM